jgi:hypothetical protein
MPQEKKKEQPIDTKFRSPSSNPSLANPTLKRQSTYNKNFHQECEEEMVVKIENPFSNNASKLVKNESKPIINPNNNRMHSTSKKKPAEIMINNSYNVNSKMATIKK